MHGFSSLVVTQPNTSHHLLCVHGHCFDRQLISLPILLTRLLFSPVIANDSKFMYYHACRSTPLCALWVNESFFESFVRSCVCDDACCSFGCSPLLLSQRYSIVGIWYDYVDSLNISFLISKLVGINPQSCCALLQLWNLSKLGSRSTVLLLNSLEHRVNSISWHSFGVKSLQGKQRL